MKLTDLAPLALAIVLFKAEVLAQYCFKEDPISKNTASASVYANYWERDGTVSAESRRLLTLADVLLKQNEAIGRYPVYLFESKPTKHLVDYDDYNICEEKLRRTKDNPIKFEKVAFTDVDDVVEWFSDISQGSGELGEKLYELCPGDCSPSYQLYITKEKNEIFVQTDVVCGHARDREDNTYQVSLRESRRC